MNVLIWLISISTDLPDYGTTFSKESPAQNFADHYWHVHSTFSYTAQISLHFSYVFCFWGRRRRGRQRMRWLMASLTRWTWVSVNSGSWWWTGRPGMLRFMGSQRVGHDWATDLIWSMFFVVIQSLSRVQLFATPWPEAHQASLSFTVSRSLLKLISLSQWCHPTI